MRNRMFFTLCFLIFANIVSAEIKLIRSTATTLEWDLVGSIQAGKKYSVEVLLSASTGKVRVIDEPLNPREKTYKAFNLKSNKVYQLRLYVLGKRGEDVMSAPSYTNLKCYSCNGATSVEQCTEIKECASNERQCYSKIRYINGKYGKRLAVYKGCKVSSDVCLPNKERITLLKSVNDEIGELTNEQILETMPGLKYFGDLDKVLARSPSILVQVRRKFAQNKASLVELQLKKKCSNRDDPEDFCRCCCTAVRCNHAMLDCGITPPPEVREAEPLPPDIATTPPETTFPTRQPKKIAPVCQVYNGGCDHVCIPLNKTTVRCECHKDYKLQENGKTCKTHLLHAVADAGPDMTITLPEDSVTISGSETKGSVKKYKWWDPIAVGSSSAPFVVGQERQDLKVSNLKAGTYKFILMVTGMDGRRTSDMMTLTVKSNPASMPEAPGKLKSAKRRPRVSVLGQARFRSQSHRRRWKTHVKVNGLPTAKPKPTTPALKFSTAKPKYVILRNKFKRIKPATTTKKPTTTKPTKPPTTKKSTATKHTKPHTTKKTAATTATKRTSPKTKPTATKPKWQNKNQKNKGGVGKKLPQKGRGGKKVTGGGKGGKAGKGGKGVAKPKSVKRKGPARLRMANSKPKTPAKKITPKKPAPKKKTPIKSKKRAAKSGFVKRKTPAKALKNTFARKPVTNKNRGQKKKPTPKHSNPKPKKFLTERVSKPKTPRPKTPKNLNFKPKITSPKVAISSPKTTKKSIATTIPAPTLSEMTSLTTSSTGSCPSLDSMSERAVETQCSDSSEENSKCTFSCKDSKTLQGGAESVTCGTFGGKSTWMNGQSPAILPCCESSCPANAYSDVIFMIHSTTKVGKQDWTKILNFVYSMVNKYTFEKDKVCVGAVRYNSRVDVKSEIPLDCSRSKLQFKRALLKMPFSGFGSNAGAALRHLMTKSFKSRNNRPRAQDVAVVITDAKSTDDIIKPSKALKASGVKIQVVGIKTKAGAPNSMQLKSMTSISGRIFNFPRILGMAPPALNDQFQNLVCMKGCQRYNAEDDKPVAILKRGGK